MAETGKYGAAGADQLRTFVAEAVGTFLLVLIGTGVACAAILGQETAGAAYDSLAIALAWARSAAPTSIPPSRSGSPPLASSRGATCPDI